MSAMRWTRPRIAPAIGPPQADSPSGARGVTLRAVLLGVLGVLAVAVLAPINDWYLHNTYFVGNHFPVGVLCLVLVFLVLVNPLLHAVSRRGRLSTAEMTVVLGMMLVASSMPSSGLHRLWSPALTAPFYHLPEHDQWRWIVELWPGWMFPTTDPYNEDVLYAYWNASADGTVPWQAWLGPIVVWAIFLIPLFGGTLLLMNILRRQWVEHEKLPFPLATVYLEIISEPEPGRLANRFFRNRAMWLAAGVVFAIHLLNGLSAYVPHVPNIPLTYDVHAAFSEEPFRFLPYYLKLSRVYFLVIGLGFLVSREVALSLWLFVVLEGVVQMFCTRVGYDVGVSLGPVRVGAYLAAAVVILWVARRHLLHVLRCAIGLERQTRREYASYRASVWGLLICFAICTGWLVCAGLSLFKAAMLVAAIYVVFLVLTRIIAETGLFYVQPGFPLLDMFRGLTWPVGTPRDLALALVPALVPRDVRTTTMPYVANSLRLGDANRRLAKGPFLLVLAAALLLAMFASGYTHLKLHYRFGAMRTFYSWARIAAVNEHMVRCNELQLRGPQASPTAGQIGIGAGLYALLSTLRLRFIWWPLHPVGFLTAACWPVRWMWFSLMIAWLCKTAVVRIGGWAVHNRVRPVFLGLAFGEALAVAFWMVVKAVLFALGSEGKRIILLPT